MRTIKYPELSSTAIRALLALSRASSPLNSFPWSPSGCCEELDDALCVLYLPYCMVNVWSDSLFGRSNLPVRGIAWPSRLEYPQCTGIPASMDPTTTLMRSGILVCNVVSSCPIFSDCDHNLSCDLMVQPAGSPPMRPPPQQ